MVHDTLFRSLAAVWPSEPDADLEEEIRTTPASLLNWLLVDLFNGNTPPAKAKKWIEVALLEAKEARKGDLVFWRLVRWTSLAAAQELMGDFGEKAAQEAADWVVPASKKAKLPRERTELATCVIGLLSYFKGDDALSAWRDKQLAQDWQEGVQASIFQTLYLAEPASAKDDLDQLSFETAHVCAKLIDDLPGKYASGLVLALARRARDKKQRVGSAIASGVRAFAKLAPITITGPDFSLDEEKGLVMSLRVTGDGKVEPMSYLFPQITGGFTRELRSFLADVAKGEVDLDKKAVLAAVKDEDATLSVVIEYDARKLEVPKETHEGLERRLELAVAHARTFESKLRANVRLKLVDVAG